MPRRRTPASPRIHRLPVRVVPPHERPVVEAAAPPPAVTLPRPAARRRWSRIQRTQIAAVGIGLALLAIVVLWALTVGRSLLKPGAAAGGLFTQLQAQVTGRTNSPSPVPSSDEPQQLHERVFPSLP